MHNRNVDAFLRIVRENDPDILLILETDEWWTERIAMLDERYPNAIKQPLGNTYGIILYSRLPLIDGAVRYLVEDTIPSIFTHVRLRSGDLIDLHSLHPRPPIPESNSEQRDAELLTVAREVRRNNRPAIVMGDLNDVAWSWTTELFQEISRTLDPRKGRGFFNSFHAEYFFLRYPLDHVFYTPHFRLTSMARGPYLGSDHFPITVSITYEPEKSAQQTPPSSDTDEQEDAEEKIEEGKEK
jgi:endonuclease/exonuclease/phosphatase (EEP) superfamily protein YafD